MMMMMMMMTMMMTMTMTMTMFISEKCYYTCITLLCELSCWIF